MVQGAGGCLGMITYYYSAILLGAFHLWAAYRWLGYPARIGLWARAEGCPKERYIQQITLF